MQTDLAQLDPLNVADRGYVLEVKPCKGRHAVARVLTSSAGVIAGFVEGGTDLAAGDTCALSWRARRAEHLGSMDVGRAGERQRTGLAGMAFAAALAMAAIFLPERSPEPAAFLALAELDLRLEAGRDIKDSYRLFERRLAEIAGFGPDIRNAFYELAIQPPQARRELARALRSA